MTTRASTGTTAASESREPKLGEPVHYVATNGGDCTGAAVSRRVVPDIHRDDYADGASGDRAYERALGKVGRVQQAVVFHFNAAREVTAAHSPVPTMSTFHYAEECPDGQ